MVLLNAAHLPPGSVIGNPLASSTGWGGRLPCAHLERHATQDLESACPRAMRSARPNMLRTGNHPSVGARDVFIPAC